jgi:hypothetical protein
MKLKYKYPGKEAELFTAVDRVLTLSRTLKTNTPYSLEYISARTAVDIILCGDVLQYLSAGGFCQINKDGEWSVFE